MEEFSVQLYTALQKAKGMNQDGLWIDPDQNITVAMEEWNDTTFAFAFPVLSEKFMQRFRDEMEEFKSALYYQQEDYDQRIESDEHPEWHSYEMAESSLRYEQKKLQERLLCEGWIFIGKGEYSPNGQFIAHGTAESLEIIRNLPDITLFNLEYSTVNPDVVKKTLGAYNSYEALNEPAGDGFFLNEADEKKWLAAIRALSIQEYGWITPQKQLIVCTLHEHMNAAFQRITDKKFLTQYKELSRLIVGKEYISFDLKRLDKNPAKNQASIQRLKAEERELSTKESEIRAQIIGDMYMSGWIRLAISSRDGAKSLHAEGKESMGKKPKELLSSIADGMGIGLVINRKKISESLYDAPSIGYGKK